MIVVSHRVADLETDLTAGEVACPGCSGRLRPWGYARCRLIRDRVGGGSWWRPRRAWCGSCSVTHVLLPSSLVVHRRDHAEVIGAALVAHAEGHGHRRIAAQLDRPAATVRGWLRRFDLNAERLRTTATVWLYRFDAVAEPICDQGSAAAGTMEALARAARACTLRLGANPAGVGVWSEINFLVAGSLLVPVRR